MSLSRADLQGLADRLVTAVWARTGPDGALPRLPGPVSRYGPDSDSLLALARAMQLAASRLAVAGGADPIGAADWYARGLSTGTDPASPHRWPAPGELGQAKVAGAAIALALLVTGDRIWGALSRAARRDTIAYLEQVVGAAYPPINWVWFQLLVEAFLRQAGGHWSRDDVAACLAVHENLYETGGWYRDGPDRAYDHYSGWALQVYPALVAHLTPDLPGVPALAPLWTQRLDRYLADAVLLVGGDGAPLIQGRSLIYRFGAAAPFWAGAVSGTTSLSPGLTRRAAARVVERFAVCGVPVAVGLLCVGWFGVFVLLLLLY